MKQYGVIFTWERQIRTIRKVLSSLSQEFGVRLDDESFRTLMCEIEAIVNSSPLTTVSADPRDDSPITPSHLPTSKSSVLLPSPSNFQRPDVYMRKRCRRVQYLANLFWSRWKREYTVARCEWPMGRVIQTDPDSKGFVRSVTVAICISTFRRPVTCVVVLVPIEE